MARLNFGTVISQSLSPARSITDLAASMRDVHADFELMYVDEIVSDTTARCRRPHWPVSIILPVRSGSSTKYLQPGQKVVVRWEDGDPNRRFIDAKTRLLPLTADSIEAILTQDWYCEHANVSRDNSWTATSLAFATASSLTGLAGDSGVSYITLPRFRQGYASWVSPDYVILNPGDEGYDSEIGGGDPYQEGPWLFQRLPDDDFIWRQNLAQALSSYVTDWTTFSADTLYITDTGETVLGWFEQTTDGDTVLPKDYLTIFANDGLSGARKTTILSVRRRDTGDTLQIGDYLCTPLRNVFAGEEYVHIWQISGASLTATTILLDGATSAGLIGAIWPNPENIIPESWVGSDHFIVQDGSGGLYGLRISGDDGGDSFIDWTYSGLKAVRPLAVSEGSLVCAYEQSFYETVTDSFASVNWTDGGNTEETREILSEGKSQLAGIVFIACGTGAQVSAFEFPGEEDAGHSLGPKTETRTTHDGQSYTSPTFYTDIDDAYWFSGWSGAFISMRRSIIPGGTAPEEPGPTETYPYATATWANDLWESIPHLGFPPVGGTGPSDTWLDTISDLFNEEREALVRQAFEIRAARPGPEYYIKRELWRSTWHSYSTTGNVYDGLHTRLGGTTYTEPPTGTGTPLPTALLRSVPSNYESTEEASAIADTEAPVVSGPFPDGEYWVTGIGQKTYSWELVKVWSNVQEEIPLTRTPSPQHALGPIAIGHGLILHGPSGTLSVGADATWVARSLSSPSTVAWTYTVASTGPEILVGNVWVDGSRFWIEFDDGAGWKLVGLDPDTGLPGGSDPDMPLDSLGSNRVVFDGTNVHDFNGAWAYKPAP